MPQLQLNVDNISEYGFPYACLLCGSDEHLEIKSQEFHRRLPSGCLLGVLLGPLAWILLGVISYLARKGGSCKLKVPVCRCCTEASSAIHTRDLAVASVGVACLFVPVFYTFSDGIAGLCMYIGVALMVLAALEYVWLKRQFQPRTLKVDRHRLVLDIPNEDYPSLYQRHLDTVMLYGSVETTGVQEEE